jgi:hypothetical protein
MLSVLALYESAKPLIPAALSPQQQLHQKRTDIRNSFAAVINYINTHGGWDVIGWYQQGMSADSSASTPTTFAPASFAQVSSDSFEIHISSLYPTNLTLLTNYACSSTQIQYNYIMISFLHPNLPLDRSRLRPIQWIRQQRATPSSISSITLLHTLSSSESLLSSNIHIFNFT